MVELGTKLRELRTQNDWTQVYVAKKIGVTSSVVSAYENGVRQPSYEALIKLASLYGVSTDYLLGISPRRSPESQHLVSLDGLTPAKILLITQLIDAMRE